MAGNLELVKKLVQKSGIPENGDAIAFASEDGHFELVKYLVGIGAPIDTWALWNAARNGHIDLVKYLLDINAPIGVWTLISTINNGQRDIAKYLLLKGAIHESNNSQLFRDEILSEMSVPVSEFIGFDITSIIIEYV